MVSAIFPQVLNFKLHTSAFSLHAARNIVSMNSASILLTCEYGQSIIYRALAVLQQKNWHVQCIRMRHVLSTCIQHL